MKKHLIKLICLILSVCLFLPLTACSDDTVDAPEEEKSDYLHTDTDGDAVCDDCNNRLWDEGALDFVPEDGKCYAILTVKDFGTVAIELLPEYAPKTVKHFIGVVAKGFYPGTTFHRILSDFMIQGGAPNDDSPSVGTVVGEFFKNGHNNTLSHERGVISMARTNDPDSASSQFFICNADYPSLDGYYAAFGRVVVGMDVVDAITDHGMKYTSYLQNGVIDDESKQPVIENMIIIDNR